MKNTTGGGRDAFVVVAILIASLTAVAFPTAGVSGPGDASSSNLAMSLYASSRAPRGWSASPGAEAEPGPTITVHVGDNVTLSLTSEDGLPHAFWVDYDAGSDASPDIDPDEPHSPTFSTATVTYTFMARREGHFTYYCAIHYPAMSGTFVVRSSPVIVLRDPILGTPLTGGIQQTIDFDVLDTSPLSQIRLWLNYSYNAGRSGGTIAGPIRAGADPIHVLWTPPRIDAPDALMNITAIDPDGDIGYASSSLQIDSTSPRVVSTFPAPGVTDASVASIRVTWSEPMAEASEWPAVLGLRRTSDRVWIPVHVGSFAGNEFTFVPEKPLARLTLYEVFVNGTARDSSRPGNAANPASWQFTTADDRTPPVITDVDVTPARALPNSGVTFSIEASDDRLMFRVFVHIVGPDSDENLSFVEEAGRVSFSLPFETPGMYNFTIWAVDAGGNFASRQGTFEIIAPSTSEPFPVAAFGLLGAAAAAAGLLLLRRKRRSRGPSM